MIICPPSKYDTTFFSTVPCDVQNVNAYYDAIKDIPNLLANEFPSIRFVHLPTCKPKTAFIQGILLPKYAIKEMHLLPEQYESFGLPIFAHIPENFQTAGIQVYDACKRIIWGNIPSDIRHCMPQTSIEKRYGITRICTHKAENINETNCVINVLYNAYYLFQAYSRYDKTGKFDLECLPHGDGK